ncbi:TSUP family transporter [Mobilitalea sibirica]|uniref:Probable membrane transporter protein n=1 Tax=Mobilitalea sibirica TaxID=1462919 RepID=A0A8J7HBR7_9FIRM|nr:TSUP family transporter [Mobilitalea sibirica]MBH1940282.1 TSUP family transporter [Mobilitalea sibirica]
MEITLEMFLIVCPLVFLAGLVDSIAGGGGLISLPAYLFAGVPLHFSIGTNKLSSAIGTTISTYRYCKNKFVDWKVAIPSVVLALIGSTIGANLALMVDEKVMKYILIVILPIIAVYVMRGKSMKKDTGGNLLSRNKVYLIACLASFFVGAYDGFYGPGTGSFLILIFTGLARMNIKVASGNTKLVNLASNIAALATFLINGKILFSLGITAAVFSVAGHYVGSGLVMKNGHKVVKPIILLVLAILFIKVISE